jgi:hypothetical protein
MRSMFLGGRAGVEISRRAAELRKMPESRPSTSGAEMSFDYAIWYEPAPIANEDGRERYVRLLAGDDDWAVGNADTAAFAIAFRQFFSRDTEDPEYPDSLYFRRPARCTSKYVLFNFRLPKYDLASTFLMTQAEALGLVLYDDQYETVRQPTRLIGSCMLVGRGKPVYNANLGGFEQALRDEIRLGTAWRIERHKTGEHLHIEREGDGLTVEHWDAEAISSEAPYPAQFYSDDVDEVVDVCLRYACGDETPLKNQLGLR